MYNNIFSHIIYNSLKLETIQISMLRKMNCGLLLNRMLYNNENKWTTNTHNMEIANVMWKGEKTWLFI